MKSKLLNKNAYEAICRNCRHGRLSPEGDTVLCVKKGIVDPDGSCRRYSYDPLKRVPRKMPAVREANPEDFDLNAGIDIPKKIVDIPSEPVKEEETAAAVETVPAEAEKESAEKTDCLVEDETPELVEREDFAEETVITEAVSDNGLVFDEDEDDDALFDDDDESLFDDDEDYPDEEDDLDEDFFDDDEEDEFDDEESLFDDDDDIIFDNDDDDVFDEDGEIFLDEIFVEEEDDPSKDWSKTSIFDVGDETEKK